MIDVIKGLSYIHIEDFDEDLDIINLKNGLFNWRTQELQPHTPEYKSIIQLPIIYDPGATCPNIDKMIEIVARPEDVEKCYEFFAYCLYRRYPIQKIFALTGPGGTGKSNFLDVLNSFLGEWNCSSASIHELLDDRFASSDLYGKMANVSGDLSAETLGLESNMLKMLTSGKDHIRAQEKNKPAFEFVNFAKLIFGANKLPPTTDDTTGFWRRFEILLFMHQYKAGELDAEFINSLSSQKEINGLFNKVIKKLPDLIARNQFTNQMDIEEAKSIYETLSMPEEQFFEKFVREEPGHFERKDDLHMYYEYYCEKAGVTSVMNKAKFGKWITKHVPWVHGKSNTGTTINGKPVAAWANTRFDENIFRHWQLSVEDSAIVE